jgi:hypothetical protein
VSSPLPIISQAYNTGASNCNGRYIHHLQPIIPSVSSFPVPPGRQCGASAHLLPLVPITCPMPISGIKATLAHIIDPVTADRHAASARPLTSVICPPSRRSDHEPTRYFYPPDMLLDVVVVLLRPQVLYSHSSVQGPYLLFLPLLSTVCELVGSSSICLLDSFPLSDLCVHDIPSLFSSKVSACSSYKGL